MTLTLIKAWSNVLSRELPYEFEFRVLDDGHFELWRFDAIWNDHDRDQWRRKARFKMRKKGAKLPRKKGFLRKRPYRFIWEKVKARWKEDGCPRCWACRFEAFALIESGVFEADALQTI